MKIKITAPTVVDKAVRYEGDIVETNNNLALALIKRGRAVLVKDVKIEQTVKKVPENTAMKPIGKKSVKRKK